MTQITLPSYRELRVCVHLRNPLHASRPMIAHHSNWGSYHENAERLAVYSICIFLQYGRSAIRFFEWYISRWTTHLLLDMPLSGLCTVALWTSPDIGTCKLSVPQNNRELE